MDFNAGGQLRSFISFRLGEDSNGQPTLSFEEKNGRESHGRP